MGGQSQFLEILPIIIHISVGLIVLKLNERLDAFPTMEFYDEEGKLPWVKLPTPRSRW